MTADFLRLLEEEGSIHQVDGADLLCIIHPVELLPGEFERLMVERQKLSCQVGALIKRAIGQDLVIDGTHWMIVSLRRTSISAAFTLDRVVG